MAAKLLCEILCGLHCSRAENQSASISLQKINIFFLHQSQCQIRNIDSQPEGKNKVVSSGRSRVSYYWAAVMFTGIVLSSCLLLGPQGNL